MSFLVAVGMGSRSQGHTRDLRYTNFFYYSTFGLVFLLVGTGLLIPLAWAAVFWALLAMLMAWFSGRKGWVSLSLQCTFLLLAAGAGSGLLASGLEALIGDPSNGWAVLKPTHIGVAVATVACLFIPVAQHSDRWGVLAGLPQLVVLALSVWGRRRTDRCSECTATCRSGRYGTEPRSSGGNSDSRTLSGISDTRTFESPQALA